MAKRVKWEPKYIENVRNEDFSEKDFDFLLNELAAFVYQDMLNQADENKSSDEKQINHSHGNS